jgi:hypothetical protein
VYPQRLLYINQTLGIYPKIETVNTEHSKSLKSRKIGIVFLKRKLKYKEKHGKCIRNVDRQLLVMKTSFSAQ